MRHTAHHADPNAIGGASRITAAVYPWVFGRENPHLQDALEGERKQVTVLFADLKSSMEFLPIVTLKRRGQSSTRSSTA